MDIEAQKRVEALRKQAFDLSPAEQYRLAFFVAENVGYVLATTLESLPPDDPKEMLDTISKLMEQIETLREAGNAVLNWYGNDRIIAFPGKQLADALGASSPLTSNHGK